jgi:hypothetical protein
LSEHLSKLRDVLPPSIDLEPLASRPVRLTRTEEGFAIMEGGRVWLLVAVNRVSSVHHIRVTGRSGDPDAAVEIRAAASSRPGGGLVVGTSASQCLLEIGDSVTLGDLVAVAISRGAVGVTYAIVDRALWAPGAGSR